MTISYLQVSYQSSMQNMFTVQRHAKDRIKKLQSGKEVFIWSTLNLSQELALASIIMKLSKSRCCRSFSGNSDYQVVSLVHLILMTPSCSVKLTKSITIILEVTAKPL